MKARRRQLRHNLAPVRLDAFGEPGIAGYWRMLDDIRGPSNRLLNPVLTFPFAGVASI